jgi:TonB-dependent starch-binding outer membrane protein SusC
MDFSPVTGVSDCCQPRLNRCPAQIVRVMKLTWIFLLTALLQVSARTDAQKITATWKNAPLEKVFSTIEQQTGYFFTYTRELLATSKPIDLDVKDATLTEVLDKCFNDQPITYQIIDKAIIVKKSGDQKTSTENIPPIDVHGHVTDSLGNPLAGATVTVKGNKNSSTTTNVSGEFLLHAINNNSTLIITNVGFESQEIKLNGKAEITIMLKMHSTTLLDVVVSKGYYNTTNRLNTGDVSIVSGEDIQKQPVSDPILALIGRVPGLFIQQTSGLPGAYSTIRLRGQNSILNGNDPLYIIDGVPYGSTSLTNQSIGGGAIGNPANGSGQGLSPFNNLNPLDIQSIEVLKDADATAIYGSRGANGVILITTKKGKAGDTKVDINAYTGVGKVTRSISLLNTPQYLAMRREAFKNDGATPDSTYDYDLTFWDTTRYTNWQKVLIDNSSPFTNVQANLSGGTPNTQFILGGGYSNQGTVFPKSSYGDQKASGHISLTHSSIDRHFYAQFSANYVNDNNNLPNSDLTPNIILAPNAPALYDANGNLNWQPLNGTATWSNPLAVTVTHAYATTYNLINNLSLNYQLISGLHIKGSFGYNQSEMNQSIITPASFYPPPYNQLPSLRQNLFATSQEKSWIIEPQITYGRNISKGQLETLVGATFQDNNRSSIGQTASGFTSDALLNNPAAASSLILNGSSSSIYHYTALFGRISYNWEEKYLVNITARRDGSSRFGPSKQFGDFGAIGLGWIFSKEKFIENNIPFLSFGKLRGSYGITGNDQIGDYQYLSTYSSNPLSYQGIPGLYPTGLTNPYFAWEKVKKMEIGLEVGVLNDLILLTGSYFRNRCDNQLIGYRLPMITGFNSVQANLPAVLQNTGLEFTLNTVNIRTKNFTWTSSANLSFPENKLISYPGIQSSPYQYQFAVGHSLYSTYLYHYTGVNPQTGTYTFATKNETGIPSYGTDFIISKPITQKYYGGIQNSFIYKGFHLDIFIQFVNQIGYNYYGSTPNTFPGNYNTNQQDVVLERWQQPLDNTNIQKFTQIAGNVYGAFRNWQISDAAISSTSFVRLKTLAFSYDLPAGYLTKAHLGQAKLYLQCQNLLTITNYQGLDPETGGLTLPPLRMITIGLQVSF